MNNNTTVLKGIEQGRAEFAFECAKQIIHYKKEMSENAKKEIEEIYKEKFENKLKEDEGFNVLMQQFINSPEKKISNEDDNYKKLQEVYEKLKKEYKSYVKKIPMLIKTNGLGATFAFMLSKGGSYAIIGEQILSWLKKDEKNILEDADNVSNFSELCERVVKLDSPEYRALTIEVLAFLNWLRRFADGLIEGEEDE